MQCNATNGHAEKNLDVDAQDASTTVAPRTLEVATSQGTYPVRIGEGLLAEVGPLAAGAVTGRRALIISDSTVAPLWVLPVVEALRAAGFTVTTSTFAAGEASKTLETFGACLECAVTAGLGRRDLIVALGGGVVGDVAGFVAASYLRGVRYIQVPTSLLAMVDSSVGGKTAVDLPAGKNLCGAFWQPSAVVADVACLTTIEPALLTDSVGEVIKYGVLKEPVLLDLLTATPLTPTTAPATLAQVVARCIAIKQQVVEADERESGLRQTLNLGHTFGHAIEAASEFELGHGTCVAIGTCMMARASYARGRCSRATVEAIEATCRAQGLPINVEAPAPALAPYLAHDKKAQDGNVTLVTIRALGQVELLPVTLHEAHAWLKDGLLSLDELDAQAAAAAAAEKSRG
jgi:3-dehydroquinate synthase